MSDYEHAILPEDNLRRVLLENLPCIAMILEKGTRKIVHANKMARDIGALPGEVCYDKVSQRSDPCPWCVAPELWDTNTPQCLQIEYKGSHYEGQWLPFSDQHYVHYIFDITKYKKAQEVLQESESRFRGAFESAAHGMALLSVSGQFLQVNNTWCNILGYTEQELLATDFQTITHPDDLNTGLEHVQQLLVDKTKSFHMEKRYIHKDGRDIWALVSVSLVRDTRGNPIHFVAQIQDIDKQKSTEKKLQESERRSYAWLEHSPVCTKVVDLDFNLQYMSACGVKELQIEDITKFYGKPYPFDFYPDSFRNTMTENLKRVKETGEVIQQEASVVDIKGNELWYHSTLVPVNDDEGKLDYIMVVSIETTEKKRSEKILRFSHDLLKKANVQRNKQTLLDSFVKDIQKFTGCHSVGIRLLDDAGNIPYESCLGFSKEFCELESPLSVETDRCMCINAITGETDSTLPFYTEGGSFYTNSTTELLATVSEGDKGPSRNECNKFGYESVALIPIHTGTSILGLIHLADPQKGKVPFELVNVIENVSIHISSAINRVKAEEKLAQHSRDLEKIVEERTQELQRANQQLKAEMADRIKAEKEAQQHYDDYLHLSRLSTVGEMASGLAHELNQPLCAIQTHANVCLRNSENEIKDIDKFRENLKVITSQSKRAGEIINGIKAFVQKRIPHHTTININEIIETSVPFLNSLLQKNNVMVDFQLAGGLPFILADPIQIEQVLINLMTNAIESMQNITTRECRLCLRTSLDSTNNKIEIVVHDTGEGFSENPDKLVEPFFTTKKGSLGIGLSVSRSIIESHGGTLFAINNSDYGSTFKFTLPIEKNEEK